jgi:hypothetical protein
MRSSARTLRIRQANGLNFSTADSTSPIPPYPSMLRLWAIFMKLRAPEALEDRPRKRWPAPQTEFLGQARFEYHRSMRVSVTGATGLLGSNLRDEIAWFRQRQVH